MAFDPDELVVAGTGHIYTADLDTEFPADIDTAVSGSWTEHGYTTEDGVAFSFAKEKKDIFAWQSFDPIRTIVTRVPKSAKFALMQWNSENFRFAIGGGTIEDGVYTPPDESVVDYRAAIIEFADGTKNYRFCYPRVLNDAPLDFATVRQDTANLAVSLAVFDPGGGDDPFFMQTDDPAFTDAS